MLIHIGNFREQDLESQRDAADCMSYVIAMMFSKQTVREYGESDDSLRFRIKKENSFRPFKIHCNEGSFEKGLQKTLERIKRNDESRSKNKNVYSICYEKQSSLNGGN